MLKLHVLYSEFINNVEDAKIDIKVIRWPSAKNDINCSEMLNTVQERKRCNRLVIIPWRNIIPFPKLIGDHFGVDVKRNGDHLVVGIILGSIWGSFRGWASFRELYRSLLQSEKQSMMLFICSHNTYRFSQS